jgi:bifunctional enzyme CysN/CysC
MSIESELDRLGIDAYLDAYRKKDLVRFLTCGSVDDGKSTLIGRLLHDASMVYEDQLAAAKRDTVRYGTTGEDIDYALLVDGLEAERQQGITIDVAYRYFTTDRRKFVIADTPGHVQYTRNMATGASNCDVAVILIDARKGVLDQTRRHSFIAALLGIKHLVVAVNKMDLVEYKREVFEEIRAAYVDFAAKLQVSDVQFIPMSALRGENVVRRSAEMPWFLGGPLLDHLENVQVAGDRNLIDFRMAVQNVVRPNADFRGYAGTIASGVVRVGDQVVALPAGRRSRVRSILSAAGETNEAFAGMAVTLTLADEVDVARGDLFAHVHNVPDLKTRHEAMVVWMNETPLAKGRTYLLKHMATTTQARVVELRYRTNVNTLRREDATGLESNEIGRVEIETTRPLATDAYQRSRPLGAFILIDRLTNATVGAGMMVDRTTAEVGLARRRSSSDAASNIHPRRNLVASDERAKRLGQRPFTLWFTGLPRSGKTSIAFALERELFDRGRLVRVLDGEALRSGISGDLGFSADDRWENQRRAAEIARLDNDLGLIAVVALVSPTIADREQARRIVGAERFFEVHCDAPLEVCEARDEDGLYARARRGEIPHVTGVDAPYEPPPAPMLRLDTAGRGIEESVTAVLAELGRRGLLG